MPRVKGRLVEAPRDENQSQIIEWYERLGCSVCDLGAVGGGMPDLLIGCTGVVGLAEVKIEGADLRPNQRTWNERWRGAQPWLVRNLDDVAAHVKHMRLTASRCAYGLGKME